MAKKTPASDLVDWTLSQAPDPGEPAPSGAEADQAPAALNPRALRAPTGARPLSSKAIIRTSLALTALAALAFLAFKVSAAWDAYRLQRGVTETVALEEQSTRLGDQERLSLLYPASAGSWAAGQLARAARGQPAPLPMASLWPTSDPAVVQSVTPVTADTARADVVRRFYAPNGAPASFVLPQYYQFKNGEWRRIAPPAAEQAVVREWDGRFVRLSYYAVDEALMLELGPYLDEKLARICAAWDCPPSTKFDLPFLLDDVTVTRGFDYFSPAPSAPMIFALLLSEREAFWSSRTLPLAAPHLAGYPADAASRDLFKRLMALEVLVRLVGGLAPPSFQFSALPYALAARLSVELDLDDPTIPSINFARPAFDSQELWALRYVSTSRPLGPFYTKVAQYQALAALNNVLAGEPSEIDTRLLIGLKTAPDPEAWLAQALSIPAGAASARLESGLDNLDHLTAAAVIPSGQALTLGCRDGLSTLAPGESEPSYFLPGSFAESRPIAWSPDSRRLLVEVSGQLVVVEAATGLLTWLPATPDYYNQIEWVTDSVLAYTLWPRDLFRTEFKPDQFGLHYFDVTNPQAALPAILGIQSFALSPDRTRMLVVLVNAQPSFERQGGLALMPALGGPLILMPTVGLSPAWSPDGQMVVYAQVNAETVSLLTVEVATGKIQRIFDSGDWDRQGQPADVTARWSPAGDRVMLALQGSYGAHFSVWSLRPDGSEPVTIYDGAAAAYANPVHFSADGAYLSVTLWDPYWQRQTAVYSTATGATGIRLANIGGAAAWAPTGHELVMSTYEGISLITNPGDPLSQPKPLTDAVCNQVLWNE